MAYIGKSIESGTFSVLDTSGNTYNGSNTAFNLGTQVGSVAQLLVSHDGVIQKPGTDYTLSSGGAAITFTTAPASGASIFIVEISGAVGGPLDSDLNGTELILDADGDTSITADTDDQIDIKIAGDDDFTFTASTLTVNSTNKICFNDASQSIQGASATVLDINATDEIELNATAIDLNGTLDVSGTSLLTGRVGVVTAGDLGTGIHVRTADCGAGVDAGADELVLENSGNAGLSIASGNTSTGTIIFSDNGGSAEGFVQYKHDDNYLRFGTGGGNERVRFTSGGIIGIGQALDGVSSDSTIGASMHPEGRVNICYSGTGGHGLMTFRNGNNEIGSISNSGTSGIAYNTSSDYRLKENVDYDFDATTRLKQLKPARFNFIADEDNTLVDGFLAHEVSSVIPEAINGTKDATETKQKVVLNSSGSLFADNIEEADWTQGKTDGVYANDTTWEASKVFPIYQGIDQSKLIPLLVKTVLELEARIATLEG